MTCEPRQSDQKSVQVRDDLLKFVSKMYGLRNCSLSRVLGQWGSSIRWQIQAQNDERFLLKEKPYYIFENEFDFHLRLHQYIQQKGGPVAPLIRTTNGELMFFWKGRKFDLQKWVDGQHLSPFNAADLQILGKLISQFHQSTLGFENPHINDWNFPRFRLSYFPDRSRKGWKKYLLHVSRALQRAKRRKRPEITRLQDWVDKHVKLKDWRFLPQQFIHGDADFFNSLKQESGRCVLVDLDDARWGYRLTDISWAAAVAAGIECSREEFPLHMNSCLRYDRAKELLKGYNNEAQLTTEENIVFDAFLGLNLVRAFVNCLGLDDKIEPPKDLDTQIDTLLEMLMFLE